MKAFSILILVLSSFQATANGSDIYQRYCAQCHGSDGEPVMPNAANFNLQEGLNQAPSSLYVRIEQGNRSCPPFIGQLKEQEIYTLINYLRTMGR